MKVILTSNIKKLGKVGDLVNVKDGFARNYLLPQKKGLRENKKNLEYFEKIKKDIIAKEKIKIEYAEKIISILENVNIKFTREADEKNQLYGSVSIKEIQKSLSENNIKVQLDDIAISEPIKSIGEHIIKITPYENLSKEIKIIVNK